MLGITPTPQKIAAISQLIKVDNSSINYSEQYKIVLTLGYNCLHLRLLINSSQNLENVDVCIFSID